VKPQESEAVREEMEKILASPAFAAAPSLARFLRYVIEETLAGRGDSLKEYTIGAIVFRRGEDFSPRVDPIVRVQARNVRARLERYYAGLNGHEPIVIELPKGTYVPVFHVRMMERPRRGWLVTAALAVAALLVLISMAVIETRMDRCLPLGGGGRHQYLAP